jgi:Raf kinase inhibitor-like YbhB/YbcL family protein
MGPASTMKYVSSGYAHFFRKKVLTYLLKVTLLLLVVVVLVSFVNKTMLAVSSGVFPKNGIIPAKYSCMGANVNPPLQISGIPPAAKSLAIIVYDPDALVKGGFTHWVVWNINTDGNIPENFKGAEQGLNSARQQGYTGMCPPSGSHHYHFKVYALDILLSLDKNTGKQELEQAMRNHILDEGDLVGTFKKTR